MILFLTFFYLVFTVQFKPRIYVCLGLKETVLFEIRQTQIKYLQMTTPFTYFLK